MSLSNTADTAIVGAGIVGVACALHLQRMGQRVTLIDREWLGHRPSLTDSLPILGRCPLHKNVFFAYGHQHIGLTAGPKSGRLIAQLASGSRTDVDQPAYGADRFA